MGMSESKTPAESTAASAGAGTAVITSSASASSTSTVPASSTCLGKMCITEAQLQKLLDLQATGLTTADVAKLKALGTSSSASASGSATVVSVVPAELTDVKKLCMGTTCLTPSDFKLLIDQSKATPTSVDAVAKRVQDLANQLGPLDMVQFDAVRTQQAKLTADLASATASLTSVAKRVQDLETKLQSLSGLAGRMQDAETKAQTMSGRLRDLDDNSLTMSTSLADLAGRVQNLNDRMGQFDAPQFAGMQKQVQQLATDLIAASDKITAVNDKVLAVNDRVTAVKADVDVGGKNLETQTALVSKNTSRLDQLAQWVALKNYMYLPSQCKMYMIADAKNAGIVAMNGTIPNFRLAPATEWDNWNVPLLYMGTGAMALKYPDGLRVSVPADRTVMWLRVTNDRLASFNIYSESGLFLGTYGGGCRNLVGIAPDGGTGQNWSQHGWIPIPVPAGNARYIVNVEANGQELWLSAIAFSTNPWNHASNAGYAYYWGVNKPAGPSTTKTLVDYRNRTIGVGTPQVNPQDWFKSNSVDATANYQWNRDHLIMLMDNTITDLYVPVVPSDKDKMVYFVEHNNTWEGVMHTSMAVENTEIERLRTTYDNPFARHFSGKIYSRYIAARIPKALIAPDKRFIKVSITMQNVGANMYVREIGTHDAWDGM